MGGFALKKFDSIGPRFNPVSLRLSVPVKMRKLKRSREGRSLCFLRFKSLKDSFKIFFLFVACLQF